MKFDFFNFHKLNRKLTFFYSFLFLIVLTIVLIISYMTIKQSIIDNTNKSLNLQIELIHKGVESSVDSAIKSYFRAAAYSTLNTVEKLHSKGYSQEEIINSIVGNNLGKSGYLVIINSESKLVYHPVKELTNEDIGNNKFVQEVVKSKELYYEYQWQNPGEDELKDKVLYSVYFDKLDWHLTLTGYKDELLQLVTLEDLEDNILNINFGETGYPVVIDFTGKFIIHPDFKGQNFVDEEGPRGDVVRQTLELRNGRLNYLWKNSDEDIFREKISLFQEISEFKIIVITTAYADEYLLPLAGYSRQFMTLSAIVLFVIFILTRVLSKTITKPIVEIKNKMNEASNGDLSTRALVISSDEVGEIANYFNDFIIKLESKQKSLEFQLDLNRDITLQLENSIKELKEAQVKLLDEERFSNMGRLLSRFSHHLNTPIGTAFTTAFHIYDIISEMDIKVKRGSYTKNNFENDIQSLLGSSDLLKSSLTKSVDLIKSFKLLQIDKKSLYIEEFDLYTLLINQKSIHWAKLLEDKIILNIDCKNGINIKNNPELLTRVLDNLVQNSVDHSFKDCKDGEINIKISNSNKGIVIEYSDNGVGIPISKKNYIFQPFFNHKNDFMTTGVGLNLVHHVVNNYLNGTIKYLGSVKNGIKYRIEIESIKKSHT